MIHQPFASTETGRLAGVAAWNGGGSGSVKAFGVRRPRHATERVCLEQSVALVGLISEQARRALRQSVPTLDLPSASEDVARLLEAGAVAKARRLLTDAPDLPVWREVLEPPRTRSRPATGRGDFPANTRWVEENRDQYRGMWVALRDGRLLASDLSRRALHRRLGEQGLLGGVLFVRVGE